MSRPNIRADFDPPECLADMLTNFSGTYLGWKLRHHTRVSPDRGFLGREWQ
ncbi:Hypothetical protein FKW44_019904 [Caligus rogercresseyi]|uniref:Uncharacterized protein n=1 Tax=Caligus rogercresseyi TaxID=217165 RepID=A0A7T8GWK9_CALRO|nr:Hypothetical protein FKW44_019904 [Caligus rogercresseyi]